MVSMKSMNLFKKCMVFVFFLSFPVCLHGYFYNLQEWTNGKQTLFLFSDIHRDTTKPYPQRIELIKAAKRLNAFVIVEDMLNPIFAIDLDVNVWSSKDEEFEQVVQASHLNSLMSAILQDFYKKNSGGIEVLNPDFDPNKDYSNLLPKNYLDVSNPYVSPLSCLTQFCHQQGIPVKNIEFRFREILNDIFEQHQRAIAEIERYKDGPILQEFYNEILYSVFSNQVNILLHALNSKKTYLSYVDFLKYDSLFFGEVFCKEIDRLYKMTYEVEGRGLIKPSSFRQRKEDIIDIYDQYLIDARILHEIYHNTQYPSIFVCAGGAHIDRIIKMLQKLGFIPKLQRLGTSTLTETNVTIPCVISIKNYLVGFYNILI